MMRILEALNMNAIIDDLKAKDKKGILEELVAPLVETTGIDQATLVKVLIERERLGSTGIGGGVGDAALLSSSPSLRSVNVSGSEAIRGRPLAS